MMNKVIKDITNIDDNIAYLNTKKIKAESAKSNKYYKNINDFISLLGDKKSYIRTRAFILICCQAKWDNENLIKQNFKIMSSLLHDNKPTVVRQCLNALKEVVVNKPELNTLIKKEIKKIDLSIYKGSMSPLIKKDIDSLMELINENANKGK